MAKGGARSGTHAPRPPRGAGVAAPQGGGGLACGGLWSAVRAQGDAAPRAHVTKNGVDVDLRSLGRQVADALAESGTLVGFGEVSPDPSETVVPQVQLRGVNAQGNDGSLDNLQVFTGFRSFLEFTQRDRKSTRLNSSHGYISYAVFCLKKKKKKIESVTASFEKRSISKQSSTRISTHQHLQNTD